jgi:hypothetical protein
MIAALILAALVARHWLGAAQAASATSAAG